MTEKKKADSRAGGFLKLLKISTGFCPHFQTIFTLQGSNLPCLSPQIPLSTAGFCLSPCYCLPGAASAFGVLAASACAPDQTEQTAAGFLSEEAFIQLSSS